MRYLKIRFLYYYLLHNKYIHIAHYYFALVHGSALRQVFNIILLCLFRVIKTCTNENTANYTSVYIQTRIKC